MGFLKKLFGPKEKAVITDHNSFWHWFRAHEKRFHEVMMANDDVDNNFLEKLMPALQQLNTQFYCLAGQEDANTIELIITAEGDIKSFVFVEELVAAAPALPGWKFTALKPAFGTDKWSVNMNGYKFNHETIGFYSNTDENYPDEIEITLVHTDFSESNEKAIANGTLIYLDNTLGELNAATLLDAVQVTGSCPSNKELIPISKLKSFLEWREKEFVEKYKGRRYNTENDTYGALEAQDAKGLPLVAIINREILGWDATASHPWMMVIEISYRSANNGMPDSDTYALMSEFEHALTPQLPDANGYLNLGRQTYNNTRTIYFACHEFRHASKTVAAAILNYNGRLSISYDIYKDKYWKTMNRFR
jgi:hypothetical protein